MSNLTSTTEIVRNARRLDSAKDFFALFPAAWREVKGEVRKLETRQEYQEPGNPSWELLKKGDFDGAMKALPATREEDVPLYRSLDERGVRFLRLRPVALPLTDYLRWEIGAYDFNSKHGELIYFVEWDATADLFERYARHDFMTFDDDLALVHDYNENGLIQGGWEVNSTADVTALGALYQDIFSGSVPYSQYLETHGI